MVSVASLMTETVLMIHSVKRGKTTEKGFSLRSMVGVMLVTLMTKIHIMKSYASEQ